MRPPLDIRHIEVTESPSTGDFSDRPRSRPCQPVLSTNVRAFQPLTSVIRSCRALCRLITFLYGTTNAPAEPETAAHRVRDDPSTPTEPVEVPVRPPSIHHRPRSRQTAMLIARRVRECGVYSELVPFDADEAKVRALNRGRLNPLRASASVYDEGAPSPGGLRLKSPHPRHLLWHATLRHQLGGKSSPAPQGNATPSSPE